IHHGGVFQIVIDPVHGGIDGVRLHGGAVGALDPAERRMAGSGAGGAAVVAGDLQGEHLGVHGAFGGAVTAVGGDQEDAVVGVQRVAPADAVFEGGGLDRVAADKSAVVGVGGIDRCRNGVAVAVGQAGDPGLQFCPGVIERAVERAALAGGVGGAGVGPERRGQAAAAHHQIPAGAGAVGGFNGVVEVVAGILACARQIECPGGVGREL